MSNHKKSYEVEIHYPETEEGKIQLTKQLGRVYSNFVKEYISSLRISNENKDKLYSRVLKHLSNQNIE